ncbi:MAG: ABC transporter ATP-binding protein [Muribaculaceae bacterium]|nr:ABC transporter ATP-binding protein [Muribaculaceae bacterium]
MTHQNRIEIIDLITGYKSRSGTKVISGPLCASVPSGCLTSLLGPNGAGKSTLLRTITGFQRPISGKVIIEGVDISKYNANSLAKHIAVVLTEKPEIDDLRTEEMIAMGRAPYTGFWGNLSEADHQIVAKAMNITGIGNLAGRFISDLSDGERQKVMIAKALAQQTDVILLDEPTAFLDFPSKVDIMRLLSNIALQEGKTIIVSTHDLDIALHLSHNIMLLDSEHGLTFDSRESIISKGDLRRYFPQSGIDIDTRSGRVSVI